MHDQTTAHPPGAAPQEEFAWEGYPGADSNSQLGVSSDLDVPSQKSGNVLPKKGKRVPVWRRLAAGAVAGVVLGGGGAVVNDALSHSTETTAPANPAPERVEDNNNFGVETYLKDEKRNGRLRDIMTRTTTEILAAIQSGEIKVSSMVDQGYTPVNPKGGYDGDAVLKGAKNGVSFTLEVYRFSDGKFSFDSHNIRGISLDVVEPKKESDVGAAIAAPSGVLFGNGKEFNSVVINSGLVELMNNDSAGEVTTDIFNSTTTAISLSEARELDSRAGQVLDELSLRLLNG